jgi:hypothetical protein
VNKEEILKKIYSDFLERAEKIKAAYLEGDLLGSQPHIDAVFSDPDKLAILTEEQFWKKCLEDEDFSRSQEIKIEERALSWDERFRIAYKSHELRKELQAQSYMLKFPKGHNDVMNEANIPFRVITITHKKETIELYE